MYLLIYGILFLSSLKKNSKYFEGFIYKLLFVILWLFLGLRWGQGTDFFGYQYIFTHSRSWNQVVNNPYNLHSEIGFRFLCYLFQENYSLMIFFISSFEMLMLYRFFKIFESDCCLSLLLFYPTFYLTYYFSALREGIAIAIFIGLGLPWLIHKKNYILFLISVIISTFFHTSSIVLILVPLFLVFKIKPNTKFFYIFIGFSLLFNVLMFTPIIKNTLQLIPVLGGYISNYASFQTITWTALLERLLSFILILYLGKVYTDDSFVWNSLYSIYSGGFLLYVLVIGNPLTSSRLFAFFKVLEIIFISRYFQTKNRINNSTIICMFIFISLIMLVKNINAYIYQGEYIDSINIMNYPYVSIFNKEDIYRYRYDRLYELIE